MLVAPVLIKYNNGVRDVLLLTAAMMASIIVLYLITNSAKLPSTILPYRLPIYHTW